MIFDWDINATKDQLLPPLLAKPKTRSWLQALLAPVLSLYNTFYAYRLQTIKTLRYNCQTIILENLLNDTFDNALRRIVITTNYDKADPVYIGQVNENDEIWIGQVGESDMVFIGLDPDYIIAYAFTVTVAAGTLTAAQEIQLKAIVNFYRFDGLKPLFIYDNGTQF